MPNLIKLCYLFIFFDLLNNVLHIITKLYYIIYDIQRTHVSDTWNFNTFYLFESNCLLLNKLNI